MPLIRTDDAPRKLRAVWLGPKGSTLPFEWTYVQWAVVIVLMPVGVFLVLSLCLLLGLSPFARAIFTILWGPALGVYLGVRLMKGVHYDEPLRYRVAVARSELSLRGRTAMPQQETWELAMPRIRDLKLPVSSEVEGPDTAGITPPIEQDEPDVQDDPHQGDTAGITPDDHPAPEPAATPEEEHR